MTHKKIMIVEDEVVVGMDLSKKLENLGYTVHNPVIRYGEKVLEAARKAKPDLILMDINLKGEMDGTQAASLVHEELGHPIIFLTAYSDKETLEKAKTAEPHAYLKKPVRADDLKISLEMALYKAEMEKRLKESELRYRMIADHNYDWETWIGPEGKYRYVSPSCERVTGYSPEKFYKNEYFLLQIVHPHDKTVMKKAFEHHLTCSDKDDCSAEFRIVDADGQIKWIEHLCRPVYGPDGENMGRRGSNRDITLRKKVEIQLVEKNRELQDALDNITELKGLIPICSHCKKIRDDKGYWNMLETYIQKYSQAKFSHGLCPGCSDELYGEEDWYIEMKKKAAKKEGGAATKK